MNPLATNIYTTAAGRSRRAPRRIPWFSYPVLALLSILASAWLILLDPVINVHAIATLVEAEAWLAPGNVTRLAPHAPGAWCVAILHQLTGWSLLATAHVFTSILYVLLCVAFVATVKTLGGNAQVQLWGALLVLIHPLLGNFRSDLSSEPGYWAFALLALRQLLIYAHQPAWKAQLLWFSCVGLATLFRLEALLVANLAPLVLLLVLPRRRRLGAAGRLLLPMWALTAGLALSGGLAAIATLQGIELPGALTDWIALLKTGNQLPAGVAIALPQLAQNPDQGWAVAGGLLGILAATLARALTAACLVLLILGWWQGSMRQMATAARSLINSHIGVTLMYLSVFAMLGVTVTPRSAVPVVLLLMLYLPFVLDGLWRRSNPIWKILALLAVVLVASQGLYNRKFEKQHVADAANWLRTQSPTQASLFSNNAYIGYFAQRPGPEVAPDSPSLAQVLAEEPWQGHPYLALYLNGGDFAQWYELRNYPQLEILKVFTNRGRDTVVVLKNSAVEPL